MVFALYRLRLRIGTKNSLSGFRMCMVRKKVRALMLYTLLRIIRLNTLKIIVRQNTTNVP